METTRVDGLINQALACRKLAWSLSDQRTQLLLHEIASEYEVRAIQAANKAGADAAELPMAAFREKVPHR